MAKSSKIPKVKFQYLPKNEEYQSAENIKPNGMIFRFPIFIVLSVFLDQGKSMKVLYINGPFFQALVSSEIAIKRQGLRPFIFKR